MSFSLTLGVLLLLSAAGYWVGRSRAANLVARGSGRLHSLPSYHGFYVALWAGIPAFVLLLAWGVAGDRIVEALVLAGLPDAQTATLTNSERALLLAQIRNEAAGIGFGTPEPFVAAAAERLVELRSFSAWIVSAALIAGALAALAWALRRLAPDLRTRNGVERTLRLAMALCSALAILTTLGIVLSLIFEALRFFARYSPLDFLFGLQWSPQTAIREDQVGSSGAFGALPVVWGTLFISLIAMLVAVPVGLMSAVYLAEYATPRVRSWVKPVLEILAGIPTVVYGFFAILTIAPLVREAGVTLGLSVAANSALAAGLVMGLMLIPFVSSLSDDVINAVPQSLRDGAAGLGATRSETVRQVVLPAALPGIVGAVLLALSRAIGETMIVVMAAGLAANLTVNPFEAVTTVTVQIVSNLTGDTEFDSAKTLSAFALGLLLFCVTLCLNVIALGIVKRYREIYD
ncbi:phosphate ABC transporter permease subunit PstC [Aquibaculum arenosum]|uniref:Phosphate transport system permease protein n=1 Tax=Aquibaculum arenosum TaxID=3032591 RepID=A0ABT5YLI4_9PROT|nr:phosphate ABC transporter permease subunit PstC [Fodinicurvata sp. CAU 1616]MDF2095696.1 phosphate ABC transporter permease subunit PstC [Fodinicurvata sp. CAU 1616]